MPGMLSPALQEEIIGQVGEKNVLTHPAELLVYECDGLTFHRHPPDMVVFPDGAAQVQKVIRLAYQNDIPFLARGAGTSLSGGAVPSQGGILLEMAKLNRILEINPLERFAIVEPGLINLELSQQARVHGLYFAPDPSSQSSCTIGGNIGSNAGGPHCLKYGSTVLHVLALEVVTAEGELVRLGSPQGYSPGFDLAGLFTGSEGTLGVITRAWVKLLPLPESVETLFADFMDLSDATRAVTDIIAAGMVPAALEVMDQLSLRAVENSIYAAGYPTDAAGILLVELDGFEAETVSAIQEVRRILQANRARNVKQARNSTERARLWAGRKGAFGAFGRIAKAIYLQDTVVPRTRLTEVIEQTYQIAEKYRLPMVNVFHAGDGNLHPVLLYDNENEDELERVLKASEEMVRVSLEVGGTLTGEHGIGLEKRDFMPYIFNENDLDMMKRIRYLFDPKGLCNPDKVLPSTKVCSEFKTPALSAL